MYFVPLLLSTITSPEIDEVDNNGASVGRMIKFLSSQLCCKNN